MSGARQFLPESAASPIMTGLFSPDAWTTSLCVLRAAEVTFRACGCQAIQHSEQSGACIIIGLTDRTAVMPDEGHKREHTCTMGLCAMKLPCNVHADVQTSVSGKDHQCRAADRLKSDFGHCPHRWK